MHPFFIYIRALTPLYTEASHEVKTRRFIRGTSCKCEVRKFVYLDLFLEEQHGVLIRRLNIAEFRFQHHFMNDVFSEVVEPLSAHGTIRECRHYSVCGSLPRPNTVSSREQIRHFKQVLRLSYFPEGSVREGVVLEYWSGIWYAVPENSEILSVDLKLVFSLVCAGVFNTNIHICWEQTCVHCHKKRKKFSFGKSIQAEAGRQGRLNSTPPHHKSSHSKSKAPEKLPSISSRTMSFTV